MKMFYNLVNSIICRAKEARASIAMNIEWVQFALQNCENFKLHSVRGMYDKKTTPQSAIHLDVMYKKYILKATKFVGKIL